MLVHVFPQLTEDAVKRFEGSTFVTLCYLPVIMEFENEEELKGIIKMWENIETKLNAVEDEAVSKVFNKKTFNYVKKNFERELNYYKEEPRVLDLVPMVEEPNSSFLQAITVKFGHLTEEYDLLIDFEDLEKQHHLMTMFLNAIADEEEEAEFSTKQLDAIAKLNKYISLDLNELSNIDKQFFKVDFE